MLESDAQGAFAVLEDGQAALSAILESCIIGTYHNHNNYDRQRASMFMHRYAS